ncbi:three-helix bundle dimerization domain-containing protein [Prauserella oleivorans]
MGTPEPSTVAHARLDQQIQALETRLAREQRRVPASVIHDRVRQERARFANARVLTFVPILVERAVRAGIRSGAESLPGWAERTARELLATELPRRWAHTQGVARAATRIAHLVAPAESDTLIAAAWLHDIGYASPVNVTGFHPSTGRGTCTTVASTHGCARWSPTTPVPPPSPSCSGCRTNWPGFPTNAAPCATPSGTAT